jgi:hypothetical protein
MNSLMATPRLADRFALAASWTAHSEAASKRSIITLARSSGGSRPSRSSSFNPANLQERILSGSQRATRRVCP